MYNHIYISNNGLFSFEVGDKILLQGLAITVTKNKQNADNKKKIYDDFIIAVCLQKGGR